MIFQKEKEKESRFQLNFKHISNQMEIDQTLQKDTSRTAICVDGGYLTLALGEKAV